MTETLSNLMPEDAELVVSLPYRVGVWISHLEDEPGATDDRQEQAALVRTLKAVSRKFEKSDFVRAVAAETLAHQKKWPEWMSRTGAVLDDCRKIMRFLETQIGKENEQHYRRFLMHVADVVAEAYGEFGLDDGDKGESLLGELIEKAASRIRGEDIGSAMNVSAAENEALEELAEILKIKTS